jgi:hypothetical protein
MSTSYEAVGRIIALTPTQRINDKLEKRTLVIETSEQYPQQIPFEAINAACSKLDGLKVGQQVEVHFNLRGRAWQDKWFISAAIWKVVATENAPGKVTENPKQDAPAANDEDLPF